MKNIIVGILALGVIGGLIAYKMYTKPLENLSTMKVDKVVTAEQLFNDFEADESAANAMYLDKVVEVSGTVIKSELKNGITTIYLETGDMLATILCQLDKSISTELSKGSLVTIKGICSGYLTDVVIVRALIV